ncbi:MAG: hypothetical protein ACT4PY_16780 [Armatimonadota bacterium]
MPVQLRTTVVLVAIVLFTTACGQLIGGTPGTPQDQGTSVHADPGGDAGAAPTYDIIEIRTVRGSSELQVRLWVNPDPALPPAGSVPTGTQFSGGVGFNTDLNRATGILFVAPCGGAQGLDRFIDLTSRNLDGTYPVRDAGLAVTGSATVSQDSSRVTFTVSFAALGTTTGRTEVNAVVGFGTFTGRDCAPDAGQALPSRSESGRGHPLVW